MSLQQAIQNNAVEDSETHPDNPLDQDEDHVMEDKDKDTVSSHAVSHGNIFLTFSLQQPAKSNDAPPDFPMYQEEDHIMEDVSPENDDGLPHSPAPQDVEQEEGKIVEEVDKDKAESEEEEEGTEEGTEEENTLALLPDFLDKLAATTGTLVNKTSDIAETLKKMQEETHEEYRARGLRANTNQKSLDRIGDQLAILTDTLTKVSDRISQFCSLTHGITTKILHTVPPATDRSGLTALTSLTIPRDTSSGPPTSSAVLESSHPSPHPPSGPSPRLPPHPSPRPSPGPSSPHLSSLLSPHLVSLPSLPVIIPSTSTSLSTTIKPVVKSKSKGSKGPPGVRPGMTEPGGSGPSALQQPNQRLSGSFRVHPFTTSKEDEDMTSDDEMPV